MSKEQTQFVTALIKKEWQNAFRNLNALSMDEMLRTLSTTKFSTIDELFLHRFAFREWYNMPRMEYAWTVVKTKSLPLVVPGDLLATGQLGTAMLFVKKAPPPPKTLQLHVFRDVLIKEKSRFKELRTRAEEIIKAQGDAFKLDILEHSKDIDFRQTITYT